MARVAFLGLGAMGSRMAARFLAAGHEVTIWNRSAGADAALVAAGARRAATPRGAVEGAEVAFSMLRDDRASAEVWEGGEVAALGGMGPGAVAVEASTLTPARIRALAAGAGAAGVAFLAVPVLGSRPQAEAGTLIHLAGGDAAVLDRLRPLLAATGSVVRHVGRPEEAALAKLLANAFFAMQAAGLAELLGHARRSGTGMQAAREMLTGLPVLSPAAEGLLGLMAAGRDAPMFPVDLVAKDLACLDGSGGAMPLAAATAEVFAAAIRGGHGAANISAVRNLY